jgi:16S rRNA (uracil1498-N3)-methyltransferase
LAAKNHDRRKYIDLVHNLRMYRVHVPGARPPTARVTGGEVAHLARVLRLSAGDEVVVFDGLGREWLGRIAAVSRASVAIDLVKERVAVAEPSVHLTLGVAVLKGAQLDDVVRDATMLGASAIVPFVSAHVAVSERGWKHRSTERWQRVAAASAGQSGRALVPEIGAVTTFESLISKGDVNRIVVCVEPTVGTAEPLTAVSRVERVLLLVGPEGGWAHDELERARSKGAVFVTLGPRTLRAVAAPTVALAALWTHWGWD